MKISGVEIRPGNIIEYEGGIWRAVKIQHTQPGKGGAYMQVEMKNLRDGRKNNVRFRSAETVERVRLDTKDFQFLFADGDQLTFMDKDTYDQVNLPRDLLGDAFVGLERDRGAVEGYVVTLADGSRHLDVDAAWAIHLDGKRPDLLRSYAPRRRAAVRPPARPTHPRCRRAARRAGPGGRTPSL